MTPGSPLGEYTLWIAAVNWDDLKRSDRSLVEAWDRPVVWVDSGRSPFRIGGRWLPARWGGLQVLRNDPMILRVTPAALPLSTRLGVRLISAPVKRWQIRSVIKKLGRKPSAVVVSNLDDVYGRWGSETVEVLRGSDDYVAGAGLMGLSPRRLAHLERRAIKKADVVLAVSKELAEKWRKLGADPSVVPNGCSPVPEETIRASAGDVHLGSPITAGLIGHLSERIDIKALEELSDAGVALMLVGPKDPHWEPERFAALVRNDNVSYLGRLPAEAIPNCLRHIDVGITPYVDSEFNRASNPLKTLEYLGAGVPVVSSALPAAQWLRDEIAARLGPDAVAHHLAIADSPREFVAEVRRLAASRSVASDLSRWRFASSQSWEHRAATIFTIVEQAKRNSHAKRSGE